MNKKEKIKEEDQEAAFKIIVRKDYITFEGKKAMKYLEDLYNCACGEQAFETPELDSAFYPQKRICIRGESMIVGGSFLRLHIREPFLTAGRKYGWHPPIGISCSKVALEYAVEHNIYLRLTVGSNKNAYVVNPKTWLEFSQKHNSEEVSKHGNTVLCVIKFSIEYFNSRKKDRYDLELEKETKS